MKNSLRLLTLAVAFQFAYPVYAASDSKTIVFVCLHGSVKSQMAAAHFNRIARERGLPYTAVSRGIEVDASIPTKIRDGLSLDGLAPADDVPLPLAATEAEHAVDVVAFDAVPDDRRGVAEVHYWSDVPPATRNYTAARDAIVRHIDDLVSALAARAAARKRARTFRGDQRVENLMTVNTERRDFIRGVGVAAASTAMLAGTQALAQANPQTGAKAMAYQPKPMSFDPKSITGISEKVLVSHYDNNYVGAVKRLNAIGAQLAELDFAKAPNFVVNGLKREELIASNSMILHEIYFDGLGGSGNARGPLIEAIVRDFGSVERWRAEFSAMGKAEGGGSGWVILSFSPRDKRLVNQWAADHTTTLAGGRPVLVLDMYEHAYHMDYGAAAARYVDVYMEAIKWDNAAKLYEQYSREG